MVQSLERFIFIIYPLVWLVGMVVSMALVCRGTETTIFSGLALAIAVILFGMYMNYRMTQVQKRKHGTRDI